MGLNFLVVILAVDVILFFVVWLKLFGTPSLRVAINHFVLVFSTEMTQTNRKTKKKKYWNFSWLSFLCFSWLCYVWCMVIFIFYFVMLSSYCFVFDVLMKRPTTCNYRERIQTRIHWMGGIKLNIYALHGIILDIEYYVVFIPLVF